MDKGKMQEEFEAAYIEAMVQRCGEGMRGSVLYSLSQKKEDGSYSVYTDWIAFWAWSASRSSVVIELPDDGLDDCREAWGERCKNTFDCGYNFASLRHEQAIAAHGLNAEMKP